MWHVELNEIFQGWWEGGEEMERKEGTSQNFGPHYIWENTTWLFSGPDLAEGFDFSTPLSSLRAAVHFQRAAENVDWRNTERASEEL